MRVLFVAAMVSGCASANGESRTDEGPLVIELFTSQGCSSCPPAEDLLGKLANAGELGGRKLAPLSFHVDYWDDLGWADPYALPAWTERQRNYARAFDDRVYTPELVIAGATGVVGSQAARVAQVIAAAPPQHAVSARATWGANSVVVQATAPSDADVFVAVWESGTRTKVLRGENAGTILGDERVVRRLERVAAAGTTGTVKLEIPATWNAGGAVAFAQRVDHRIVGATLLPR